MKKLFTTASLKTVLYFSVSFLLYITIIFLSLFSVKIRNSKRLNQPSQKPVQKTQSDVMKYDTPVFAVLLSCDELLQYSAVLVDLESGQITVTLLSTKESAKNYGINFARHIEYGMQGEKNIISYAGGIVIDEKSGYNRTVENQEMPCRIFGNTAVNFAKKGLTERSVVAERTLCAVLCALEYSDDWEYFCEQFTTDISYADYCKYRSHLAGLSKKITVVTGYESN